MRKLTLLLAIAVLFTFILGCNKKDKVSEPIEEGCELLVYCDRSAASLPFVKLYYDTDKGLCENTYDIIVSTAEDNMMELVLGRYDVAVLPSVMAYELYDKTEGNTVFLAVASLAECTLLSNSADITDIYGLDSKTVYTLSGDFLSYSALMAVFDFNGINASVEELNDINELIERMNTEEGCIAAVDDIYLDSFSDNITGIADIDDIFNDCFGYELPGEIICVNRKFLNANPYPVKLILKEYSESLLSLGKGIDDSYIKEIFGEYDISVNRVTERINSIIVGEDMKNLLLYFTEIPEIYDDNYDGIVAINDDLYYFE
ncbi:MAG: hypothetical protein E7591_00530 [Ruminococcaceae bacterium]|nr:hypothetical protein [Oscillospiraceae bacterium]